MPQEPVDLATLVASAVDSAQAAAQQAGLTLEVNVKGGQPTMVDRSVGRTHPLGSCVGRQCPRPRRRHVGVSVGTRRRHRRRRSRRRRARHSRRDPASTVRPVLKRPWSCQPDGGAPPLRAGASAGERDRQAARRNRDRGKPAPARCRCAAAARPSEHLLTRRRRGLAATLLDPLGQPVAPPPVPFVPISRCFEGDRGRGVGDAQVLVLAPVPFRALGPGRSGKWS